MEKWQDPETLALWFGIIIFFVLALVVSIILLVRFNYQKIIKRQEEQAAIDLDHQRQLLETSIAAQEKERDRIAADLHDGLIGKLTAMRLKHQIDNNKDELDKMISDSIVVARRITHDLSPPLIEHTPLSELIKDLADPWNNKFELTYKKDIRENFELSPKFKTQLTRIVQEILTNISKHAEATKIEIHLRQTANLLALYIADNGKGIDMDKMKRGLGLKNIESRVQYVRGTYKVRSKKNLRTSFIFLIPSRTE